MFQKISIHLNLAYDIIKIIHKLYIKYKLYIKVDSFESCGRGIDTIYNVIQSNVDGPISLYIKLHLVKDYDNKPINTIENLLEYILFLPISVITPIGLWKFVDNPHYIVNDNGFSLELIKLFNLKFIYQSYYDTESFILYEPIFIPTKVIDKIYLVNYEKYKKLDIRYLFNVFDTDTLKDFPSINENRQIYFNNLTYGSDVCEYIFNKFINNLFISQNSNQNSNQIHSSQNSSQNSNQIHSSQNLNQIHSNQNSNQIHSSQNSNQIQFDDYKLYYKYYVDNNYNNKIFNDMKTYFENCNIYGYNKTVYRAIFYYNYLNYFGKYD